MKKVDFHFVLIFGGLLSLVILYFIIGIKTFNNPQERTGADYIAFYSAGRISKELGISRVYDISLQKSIEERVTGLSLVPGQTLIFAHVPFLVPLISLFANTNYSLSYLEWMAFIGVIIILDGLILILCFPHLGGNQWIFFAGVILFYPLFISLLNGQDTALVLLGLCIALLGFVKDRDWLIGIGLSISVIRPQIFLILVFPYVFKRQKILKWSGSLVFFFGLISVLLLGKNGVIDYVSIMRINSEGIGYGINEPAMVNFIGLLFRSFSKLGGSWIHLGGWILFMVAAISLGYIWRASDAISVKHLGVSVIVALFVSPHLHYHDLGLLLIPLVVGIMELSRGKVFTQRVGILILLFFSLIFLFSSQVPLLKYNITYVVMIAILIMIINPAKFIFWRKKEI